VALGIFGGTFDPPHLGHLILAAEAQAQLDLVRILWILTAGPPHKQGLPVTPINHRLDMLVAAIGDDPCFEISRVDIDRPAPHYAVDTVRLLAATHPGEELVYLMGGDSLRDLPSWHQPEQFIDACDKIAVMRRPGDRINRRALERRYPRLSEKLLFITAPLLNISSSEIRMRIAEGRPAYYYLPGAVYELIQTRHLYHK
jgi:nicotinate-nucleotide adenylyltransferase